MSLTPPSLDNRRFEDLVHEARQRIPRYTPEWTNFNDSDPGMTLVQLHAWLTETILFSLNQVPDLNYVSFLNLIGLKPQPARPARAELTFTLEDRAERTVYLPPGVKVAVDDPALLQEIVFETDRAVMAIDAAIGAVLVPSVVATTTDRQLITLVDEKGEVSWLHSFEPFGASPVQGSTMFIGLVLRPQRRNPPNDFSEDRFPAEKLDIYIDAVNVGDKTPEGAPILGPLIHDCPPPGADDGSTGAVRWSVFTGSPEQGELFDKPNSHEGWTTLGITFDETRGLTRSGHIVLEIPSATTPINPNQLPEEFWRSFGQERPPLTRDDLIAALKDGLLQNNGNVTKKQWQDMGLPDDKLSAVLACGEDGRSIAEELENLGSELTLDPTAVSAAGWVQIEPKYDSKMPMTGGHLRRMTWLKAVFDQGQKPTTIREARLNTVPATQAATRLDERVGASNGRPGQTFRLQKTPVLIDPLTDAADIELTLVDLSSDTQAGLPEAARETARSWTRVDSLFSHDQASRAYMLDPHTGTISFGDGRNGQIPVAGLEVVARRYRHGGGKGGNVAPGKITALKGRIAGVKSVINVRESSGGSDAETLDSAKLRAPHDLRTRDRAVTFDDFAYLTKCTPTVAVHKAYALPHKIPSGQGFIDKDGAVTVVVLPASNDPMPQPSPTQMQAICAWLEPRRLITTELHVTGPHYTEIAEVSAKLGIRAGYDLRTVGEAAQKSLTEFLHPLRGGADGTGWPFGEDIFHGDLYDRLLGIAGVRRVSGLALRLKIEAAPGTDTPPADVTALPDGRLPYLPAAAVKLDPHYE